MEDFDPVPPEAMIEEAREDWKDRSDTFTRVYRTLLGIREYTSYEEISDIAGCSPNSAKKHLDRLVEMGIASENSDLKPAIYRRKRSYIEWNAARRIADDLEASEITERVGQLEAREEAFQERFDSSDPASVSAFAGLSHEDIHQRMVAIGEWRSLRRDIRLYQLAHYMVSNNGHLLPE